MDADRVGLNLEANGDPCVDVADPGEDRDPGDRDSGWGLFLGSGWRHDLLACGLGQEESAGECENWDEALVQVQLNPWWIGKSTVGVHGRVAGGRVVSQGSQ